MGFDWLKTETGGHQEIDIWVPDIKLAIEYDGEQHFKLMRYKSKKEMLEKLKRTQELDKIKNDKVFCHPEDINTFIRINYTEKITYKNITKILKKYGVIE